MTNHGSASARAEKPHATETTTFTLEKNENQSTREKIEALAEIICGAGDEPAAALFVLMGTLQNSTDPTALANATKHFAFTHCGDRNVYGIVDAQIAVLEAELLTDNAIS